MDPAIVNLTKAISLQESSKDGKTPSYDAVGDNGTSHGAYQWQPGNFEAAAKAAGLNPSDMSPENQNKVAYAQVKSYRDRGFTPAQIAAAWNAGETKAKDGSWQQNVGTTTINGKPIHYDTPGYVAGVNKYYRQLAGTGTSVSSETDYNPKPFSNPTNNSNTGAGQFDFAGGTAETPKAPDDSLLGQLGTNLGDAGQGVASAAQRGVSGEINPLSSAIQGAGAIGKGIGDVTNTVLTHTPIVGGLLKAGENVIGDLAQKAAGTGIGKSAIQGYQGFEQEHPEAAGDIGGLVNIATAIPMLKGLGLAKSAVTGAVERGLVGGTDSVLEAVAPKLSARETAEAISKRGTTQQGVLRKTVLNPDKRVQEIAGTVKENVPGFNPSKPLVYNINQTQQVVSKMADDLKQQVLASGKDKIYPFQELASKLNSIERPLLVSSDTTLNNAYDRVISKAMDIIKSNGGKVSNLLDARQEFDAFIQRQFPNLYNSETLTPMRQAVKDIRNGITNFTAGQMPEVALKESLLTQHRLITAIENMAEKAASGVSNEIGSTAISRVAARHPLITGLVKKGLHYGAEGLGVGAGLRALGE